MINDDLKNLIADSARYTFSRSSGPGGQNVNKVNTRVTLRLTVSELCILSDNDRELLREKLKNRINEEGEIVIHSSTGRSQRRNRQLALDKVRKLIENALKRQKRRRATAPSKNAVQKRLLSKKKRGAVKRDRQKPVDPGMSVFFLLYLCRFYTNRSG